MIIRLENRHVNGGVVSGSLSEGYQLRLPELQAGKYGLAQVDNYSDLPRCKFAHQPPLIMRLEARVSGTDLPGTWGFGLWNDPFSFGLGGGGMTRILPALPNAAWFFYGSKENHLSLRDNQPGSGFHAKTFRSPRIPSVFSILAAPSAPFMLWPAFARVLRKMGRFLVKEAVASITVPVDAWHAYELHWMKDQAVFMVDQTEVLRTKQTPRGRLGLVIWIDNQYFSFDPSGKLQFGFLEVRESAWLQVRHLRVS